MADRLEQILNVSETPTDVDTTTISRRPDNNKTSAKQVEPSQHALRSQSIRAQAKDAGIPVPEKRGLTRKRSATLNKELVQLIFPSSQHSSQAKNSAMKLRKIVRFFDKVQSTKSHVEKTVERVPYHAWNTRTDPFSKQPCSTFTESIPTHSHPHKDHYLGWIRSWCSPLHQTDSIVDIIIVAEFLCVSTDEEVEFTLQGIFNDIDPSNPILQDLWSDAIRFLRWYFWRHTTYYESMMLLVARFGLTF